MLLLSHSKSSVRRLNQAKERNKNKRNANEYKLCAPVSRGLCFVRLLIVYAHRLLHALFSKLQQARAGIAVWSRRTRLCYAVCSPSTITWAAVPPGYRTNSTVRLEA